MDTVGFIRKLPHQLVEAFRSTLEEALYADLLVVVSDLSSPEYAAQRQTVLEVLSSLGAGDKPMIEALNKADVTANIGDIEPPDAVVISASTGAGLDRLVLEIGKRVQKMRARVELVVPYDKGAALSLLHREGQILEEEYLAEGTRVVAMLDASLHQRALKLMK